MVFILMLDIVHDRTDSRRPDGERPIPALPGKIRHLQLGTLRPSRGVTLDLPYQLRHATITGQLGKNMNVVGSPSNPNCPAVQLVRYLRKICVKPRPLFDVRQERVAELRRKNDVVISGAQRLRHRTLSLAPTLRDPFEVVTRDHLSPGSLRTLGSARRTPLAFGAGLDWRMVFASPVC